VTSAGVDDEENGTWEKAKGQGIFLFTIRVSRLRQLKKYSIP